MDTWQQKILDSVESAVEAFLVGTKGEVRDATVRLHNAVMTAFENRLEELGVKVTGPDERGGYYLKLFDLFAKHVAHDLTKEQIFRMKEVYRLLRNWVAHKDLKPRRDMVSDFFGLAHRYLRLAGIDAEKLGRVMRPFFVAEEYRKELKNDERGELAERHVFSVWYEIVDNIDHLDDQQLHSAFSKAREKRLAELGDIRIPELRRLLEMTDVAPIPPDEAFEASVKGILTGTESILLQAMGVEEEEIEGEVYQFDAKSRARSQAEYLKELLEREEVRKTVKKNLDELEDLELNDFCS